MYKLKTRTQIYFRHHHHQHHIIEIFKEKLCSGDYEITIPDFIYLSFEAVY